MKFFVDSANITEIEELIPTGFVNGVTTNPSLIAKQGADMKETIKNICSIVEGPVSAEVTATDYENMLKEGEYLASIAKNVAVKVPLTHDGLKTCKKLTFKLKTQVFVLGELIFCYGFLVVVPNLISIGRNLQYLVNKLEILVSSKYSSASLDIDKIISVPLSFLSIFFKLYSGLPSHSQEHADSFTI